MYYLDTQVILAYSYDSETEHDNAVKVLKDLDGDYYTSPIGLLELYGVVSRNVNKFELPSKSMQSLPVDIKVGIIVDFAIKKLNIKCCVDNNGLTKYASMNVDISSRYHEIIQLAPKLQLHAGDSLHVSYATDLMKSGKIKYIVSLDKHFKAKKENIKRVTGIELITEGS